MLLQKQRKARRQEETGSRPCYSGLPIQPVGGLVGGSVLESKLPGWTWTWRDGQSVSAAA